MDALVNPFVQTIFRQFKAKLVCENNCSANDAVY